MHGRSKLRRLRSRLPGGCGVPSRSDLHLQDSGLLGSTSRVGRVRPRGPAVHDVHVSSSRRGASRDRCRGDVLSRLSTCLAVLLTACVESRPTPSVPKSVCRYQVQPSEGGCRLVEFDWVIDKDGLAQPTGGRALDLDAGATGEVCGQILGCESPPPRSECAPRGSTRLAMTFDGGSCLYGYKAPIWGYCEVVVGCGERGGIGEGVIYIPEGHAGRAGMDVLFCSCTRTHLNGSRD